MWWRKSVDAYCCKEHRRTAQMLSCSCKVTEIQILTHIKFEEHQEMKEILPYIICYILDFVIFTLGYVVGKKSKRIEESIKK